MHLIWSTRDVVYFTFWTMESNQLFQFLTVCKSRRGWMLPGNGYTIWIPWNEWTIIKHISYFLTLVISPYLNPPIIIKIIGQIFQINQVIALKVHRALGYNASFFWSRQSFFRYLDNNQTSKRAKDTWCLTVSGTARFLTEQHPNWLGCLEIVALYFLCYLRFLSYSYYLFAPIFYHSKSNRLFRDLTPPNYCEVRHRASILGW